jgi:hypothetical protein
MRALIYVFGLIAIVAWYFVICGVTILPGRWDQARFEYLSFFGIAAVSASITAIYFRWRTLLRVAGTQVPFSQWFLGVALRRKVKLVVSAVVGLWLLLYLFSLLVRHHSESLYK